MKIDNGEIKVNDKIKLGIKYHNKFFGNIPRKEIDKIYKMKQVILRNATNTHSVLQVNRFLYLLENSVIKQKHEFEGNVKFALM